ncbi:MAG: PAS domain S-box protein [Prolixibacteraceae bacterium]|nr:PAS domain S-box protein [Prolixibacteraceae bacterium]
MKTNAPSGVILQIMNSIQVPMVLTNPEGYILVSNQLANAIHQYSENELSGKNIFSLLFPQAFNEQLYQKYLEATSLTHAEYTATASSLVTKNKEHLQLETSCSILNDDPATFVLFSIDDRRLVDQSEQKCREKENLLNLLNKASYDILELPDLKSCYQYICKNLQSLFPHAVVLYVEIKEDIKETQLIDVAGLEQSWISKAEKITGFKLIGKKFKLHQTLNERFKTGKFTEFKGGLAEFSMQQFPEFAAKTLQKMVGIHHIYTIGINKGDELLGAVHFFTLTKQAINEGNFIELYVKQAGSIIQNRMMQELLMQSEKRFRSIFEEAPMGIALIDSQHHQIIDINDKFAEIVGWDKEEIMTTDWMDITHPDDVETDLYNMARLNSGEIKGYNLDKRYIRKDGSIAWVNLTVTPLMVKDLSLSKHLAIIDDITVKKQSLEQIQRERILLRTLIDNIPDSIYVKDIHARKILANKADVAITGNQSESEIIGKTDLELFPSDDGENGFRQDMQVLRTGKPIINNEQNFIDKKGQKQWIQTTKVPLYNELERLIGLVGIGRDINAQKLAEEQLKQNLDLINSLIESIPMGMNVLDSMGNILFQNNIFIKQLGYDALGKKCWDTYRDDKSQCSNCPLKTGIELGVTKMYEENNLLGGKIIQLSQTGILYNNQIAMLEIFHDITPIRESEIKLKHYSEELKKSNAAKDKLFSIIGHDLKNPFTSILGLSSLLKENIKVFDEEELSEIVAALHSEGNNAFILLENLLNWSRSQLNKITPAPTYFKLRKTIEQVIRLQAEMANKKKIALDVNADHELKVFADETMIETVLRNLLSNAIKFSNEKSTVSIEAQKTGHTIRVSIKDSGVGMDTQVVERLFTSGTFHTTFGTSNEKGTGLGLHICKDFIEMNKGAISVESEKGIGSVFYFTVPSEAFQ